MPKAVLHNPRLLNVLLNEHVEVFLSRFRRSVQAMYADPDVAAEAFQMEMALLRCLEKIPPKLNTDAYEFFERPAIFQSTGTRRCICVYQVSRNFSYWTQLVRPAWDKDIVVRIYGGKPCVIVVRKRLKYEAMPLIPDPNDLKEGKI